MTVIPNTRYSAHQPKQWNPDTVIELKNCFGTTRKGYRCRNNPARAKVSYARAVLNELATMDPITASTSPRLLDAVSIMLCYHHTSQLAEVAHQWKTQIRNCTYASNTKGYERYAYGDTNFSQSGNAYTANWNSSSNWTSHEGYDFAELLIRLEELREAFRKASHGSQFSTQQGSQFNTQQGNYSSTRQGNYSSTQHGSQFNTEQGSQSNTQQENYSSTEQGSRPHQQRNRGQQGQDEEEKRRMHEHTQKGRPANREEGKERQEREQRERDNRESTGMQAHEKEAATQACANAWRRYCAGWEAVEEGKGKIRRDQIPWPTTSGKWEDVTEESVRDFFLTAPIHLSNMPGEEMFRIISRENKRWHTDKIIFRFGREILKAPCGNALNIITKVVVELRKEAKMGREG